MTAYLGALGALVPVECPSTLASQFDRPASTRTTLGGRRTARFAARGHRSWSVSTSAATPSELANLAAVARGDFGAGPFWWLDEWAQQSNLLDPADSALSLPWGGMTVGGPVALPDGPVLPHHLISEADTDHASVSPHGGQIVAPVIPGVPVTISAWINGQGARLRGTFQDISGGPLDTVTTTQPPTGWTRMSATGVPPEGAASIRFLSRGVGAMAGLAVTYTSDLREYGPGAGARHVIVTSFSQDVRAAWRGAMYADQSYQIMEVG